MTSSTRTAVRRVTTLSVASLTAFVLMSSPALADVPSGWSNPPHLSFMHFVAVILLPAIGLALVIAAIVLLPGVLKGEGLLPKPFPKPEHVEDTAAHH